MSAFNKNAGGFMDEIRCDEPSYLIWKWRPAGSQKGANRRENAIRWGSSLRVRDGAVAAFVYHQKDGTYQDFIEGPYDQILKTANLPVLASIVGLAYDGGTPFQAEVYFINLAQVVQIRFGVPFFDVYDPRFLDFGVPVAVRGTVTFAIKDYRQFIKLHRLDEFDLETFKSQVKDAIRRYLKGAVANAPTDLGIPLVQIERGLAKIHDAVEPQVKERLSRDFGVAVSGVDISAIELDKTSDGYRRLMSVTRDVEQATVQAQTEVNIKNLHDQQRINAENLEETLRIQREEAQRAQRMTTETANIGAFQLEKQAEVGVAGASALGQMGANGATEMGAGSGGGFDPAAMMAGMAVGGAVGQNVAGMMNGMMGGLGGQPAQPGAQVPPPVPQAGYHVAVNGAASGPFSPAILAQMVAAGALTRDSLVWKQGMAEWRRAGDVDELASVFGGEAPAGMAPIPPAV
ncbi:SPFH domain-containing protein [Collinsella sp. An307]|uniref:SPFH domain-containing protein n=1 Tax=Collinsella sp. An307 TaxID=1965630 RepID=UPI000B395E40|nr:SPFH domain-containing protein [Collinsella sp. An307]OUO20506.1 virion core protein (lumpy skin disease virus) [Collinsella sp. An307]